MAVSVIDDELPVATQLPADVKMFSSVEAIGNTLNHSANASWEHSFTRSEIWHAG